MNVVAGGAQKTKKNDSKMPAKGPAFITREPIRASQVTSSGNSRT
jgi:hypothetical protein